MLRFAVLGSGSSGNSALVFSDNTRLLVDAGISSKQLHLRMEQLGVAPDTIDGILLTHEHSDHTRGLEVFCRKVKTPVYCSAITRESLSVSLNSPETWKIIEGAVPFVIGDIAVSGFTVMHDAVDPLGYVFECGGSTLGFASDLGHVTGGMQAALQGAHSLFIEANYDDLMLQNDTRRPWSLKQRIASRHGHLSNAQAAELITEIAGEGQLQRVVLGHLSEDCNCPEAAMKAVCSGLHGAGVSEVDVFCAGRDEPCGPFPVNDPPVEDVGTPDDSQNLQGEFALFS
ncbi:MAG: MBL fold metallo-hydrolase [Verrucomicrobiaceae bacterium]|nr:MBL fold metallo-hydrolase [Verrucomicrobiaceae bacterium]